MTKMGCSDLSDMLGHGFSTGRVWLAVASSWGVPERKGGWGGWAVWGHREVWGDSAVLWGRHEELEAVWSGNRNFPHAVECCGLQTARHDGMLSGRKKRRRGRISTAGEFQGEAAAGPARVGALRDASARPAARAGGGHEKVAPGRRKSGVARWPILPRQHKNGGRKLGTARCPGYDWGSACLRVVPVGKQERAAQAGRQC